MKLSFFLLPLLFFVSAGQAQNNAVEKELVSSVVDSWHQAAAETNFDLYFGLMTDDAIFIGTDATENWNKTAFKIYAKPHFDKGQAWNFTPLQRNIYLSADKKTAWFDELLDTQMKICRGSGIVIKVENEWKIAHYVLSISIPNEVSNQVIKLKTNSDNLFIKKLKL